MPDATADTDRISIDRNQHGWNPRTGEFMNLTLQEEITNARTLWASALPDVPAPPDSTFRLWLTENDHEMFEGALTYAPRRVERLRRNGRYTPAQVYKYVSTFLYQTKIQQKEPTLLDAINNLTPAEAKDPANVIRTLNLLVFEELIRYQKKNFFQCVSDATLRNIRLLQETTDLKTARNLAAKIVDCLECSSLNDGEANGSALRRLAQIERAINERGGRSDVVTADAE